MIRKIRRMPGTPRRDDSDPAGGAGKLGADDPGTRRSIRASLPLISLGLAGSLVLAGCTAQSAGLSSGTGSDTVETTETTLSMSADAFTGDLSPTEVLAANADYTTVNDDEWSESDAVDVELTGSGATSESDAVTSEGSTVTITEAGVYRLSGSLDGGIVVAAPDDALVVLILDGVDITNSGGSAIDVQSADDVAISLAEGSENSVSDAASYADDAEANAAIHASTDLTISGTGSLSVTGNGNDGIVSTDDLVILSGSLSVTAADDALRGKDALVIEGGELQLTAEGGDGLKSNGTEGDDEQDETQGYILVSGGTIDITAGDDGVQAYTDTVIMGGSLTVAAADDGVKAETIVSIAGGEITVSESTEGVEAASIGIFDGVLDITASDDGINASGLNDGTQDREADTGERLEISGGTVTVNAAFDGLDSNGSITVSGGTVDITSAANGGDGPLDANGEVSVAEGTVTANGTAVDPATAGQSTGGPGGGGMPGGGAPGGGSGGGMPGGQGGAAG